MRDSVDTILGNAIVALRQHGEEAIASALGDLLATCRLAELRPCRASEVAALADAIFACDSLDALHALLPRVASALGVAHCTIHSVQERGDTIYRTRVLTTYSDAFVAEYVERRYALIDPVVLRCRQGPGTFFWEEAYAWVPMPRVFHEAVEAHGVGPGGITFVSENARGDAVAVSLAAAADHAAFRRIFTPRIDDFNGLAALMIEVFAERAGGQSRPSFGATGHQLALLRALVCGGAGADLKAAKGGTPATVEEAILETFGAKTLSEAASLAGRAGLLHDLPYLQGDVFSPAPAA